MLMLQGSNKLEKLKIKVWPTEKRMGLPIAILPVKFNPEEYSLKYENEFAKLQGINTSGRSATFALGKPGELSIKLILDGTGVDEFGAVTALKQIYGLEEDVYKQVDTFLKATTRMRGKTHEPSYLKLEWGKLIFKCRLKSVNIRYYLFDRSGTPLRAELDCVFFRDIPASQRLKEENKSSPDLTHSRVVKAGDDLLRLTEEIYGTPDYYLEVAAANGLDNFRNLKPGVEIFFPPIDA